MSRSNRVLDDLQKSTSLIHLAVCTGNRKLLRKIIQDSPAGVIEKRDYFGRSPLLCAVAHEKFKCVSILLKAGACVDSTDNVGQTALHLAINKDLHQYVHLLLSSGALWYQKNHEGVTALHYAASNESVKCLLAILSKLEPGEIDMQDALKKTALHWAAAFGYAEHVRLLLNEGANICIPDITGKTPLHWAALNPDPNCLECVEIMVINLVMLSIPRYVPSLIPFLKGEKQPFDVLLGFIFLYFLEQEKVPSVINWQDYEGRSALHLAVLTGSIQITDFLTSGKNCNLQILDNQFSTPMHLAARKGYIDKLALLLDRGADYKTGDASGATAMHYAAYKNNTEAIKVFLTRAYVEDVPDSLGRNALIWAASNESNDVIQMMSKYGVDLSYADNNGFTALHAAASLSLLTTVELLVDLRAPVNATDKTGSTPLLIACDKGNVKIVRVLIDHGASLLVTDFNKRNSLHRASHAGIAYLVQLLFQLKPELDCKDYLGQTPLHFASTNGSLNCVSVLLESCSKPDVIDNQGRTPLHYAAMNNHCNIVRLLLQYGAFVNPMTLYVRKWITPLDCALLNESYEVFRHLRLSGGLTSIEIKSIAAKKIQIWFRKILYEREKKLLNSKVCYEYHISCHSHCGNRRDISKCTRSIAHKKDCNLKDFHKSDPCVYTLSNSLSTSNRHAPKSLGRCDLLDEVKVEVYTSGSIVSATHYGVKQSKSVCTIAKKTLVKEQAAIILQRAWRNFPKDPNRRSLWAAKIKRNNFKPSDYSKLCSLHFADDCFDQEKFGGRWLKPTAVPTIFNFPCHLQSAQGERKPIKRVSSSTLQFSKKRKLGTEVTETVEPTNLESEGCSNLSNPPVNEAYKRLTFVGDFKDDVIYSPSKQKKRWLLAKQVIKRQKKTIRSMQQKHNRLQKRVATLSVMLNELKRKNLISEPAKETLELALPEAAVQLIKRAVNDVRDVKYPPELRSFALTLHFYSGKAYDYIRKNFNTCLPHPATLRKWYGTVSGKPGFTTEALRALKIKVSEAAVVNKQVFCSLIMDEMSIRKHIEWDGKKLCGYVDMGTEIEDDQLPIANQALTLMLNVINGHWKIPIGYFLIDGLAGAERANIVNEALHFIHGTGICVNALTFDGTKANISMANQLGANIEMNNMRTKFKHPITGKDIYIFLDACHMLKLVRNTLSSKGSFVDPDGGLVSWAYISDLEKFQSDEGLSCATKLRKRHIQWHCEKMKVKLAAQTFSRSVAVALTYLSEDLKVKTFQGCQPTVNFVQIINDLFDILNSRNYFGKGFKSPMKAENEDAFSKFMQYAKTYIKSLKTHKSGQLILQTNVKTGFLGFLVCIESILGLYNDLIKGPNAKLQFLLSYKFSQDHLETFFSAVRSKGGHNNNPTAIQFAAAYKRLLIHHEIKDISISANCMACDETSILTVSSSSTTTTEISYIDKINFHPSRRINYETPSIIQQCEAIAHDHTFSKIMDPFRLSEYVVDIITYIAGFISKQLVKKLECEECALAIKSDSLSSSFFQRKNMKVTGTGGLTKPSSDLIHICQVAEKSLRLANSLKNVAKGKSTHTHFLITETLSNIRANIFECLEAHSFDQEPLQDHRTFLIKSIIQHYFKIRLNHLSKCMTQDLHESRIRSKNTKLILFKGQ